MCLESDIRQIEELRDSLLEDFNQTSPNFEELQQLEPFGLLEEDWKRLSLLESRIPDGSFLKSKLLIVFRILIAALYQAYGQSAGNKVLESGKVNSDKNSIEQESNSLTEESLDFGESKSHSVVVNVFTQEISSVDVSEEKATTSSDNLAKYGETATSTDSVILHKSNLNTYFENNNRSYGSEVTGFFTKDSETNVSSLKENRNGSNDSLTETWQMNPLNTLFEQSDSPMLEEAVDNGSYTTSQNKNFISSHVNRTSDSFVKNQAFERTDETDFSITTIINEVQEKNYIYEDKYVRPINAYGDSNSSELEDNIDKSLQETTIGDPTEAASDTIYSFVNFSNFNNQQSNESSPEIAPFERYTHTSKGSPVKEGNIVRYNYTLYDNPHNPASDSFTSTGSPGKQESHIEDSHEPSENPFDTTSDIVTSTGLPVKQDSHIGDSHEPSKNPFHTTSDSVTSTGSPGKQESNIRDSHEPSENPFDTTSDSDTSTDSPVKQESHIGYSHEPSKNPFDTTSDSDTSTDSPGKQENHKGDSHETSNSPYDSASDTFTSTVNLTADTLVNSQVFERRDELELPTTSVLSKIQEQNYINEDNRISPKSVAERFNSSELEDNNGQTLQESEIAHPTEAASGVIYSFVNFSNFQNQQSNENSKEIDLIQKKTKYNFTSRVSTPLNQVRDSDTLSSNPYDLESDTFTSTDSPVNTNSYIVNSFQPYNKSFTSEAEITYGSETIKTIHEQQDLSEDDTESSEDKNMQHYINHKRLNSSIFNATDLNVHKHNQPADSIETRTPTSSQEINPSSESNLKEDFKEIPHFDLSENGGSANLESNISNENLFLTTPSDLVLSIQDYLDNKYLGSYHYGMTEPPNQTPFDISSETVDSTLSFDENTQVFEDENEKQKPIYTTITDRSKNNFESNLFHPKYPGDFNEEIDSKLENPNEILSIKHQNKQRNSIEEQEFDQYKNNEPNNDIKYSPGDQETNFSVEDERNNSSSKYEEEVVISHGEIDKFYTLNDSKTYLSGEENSLKYNTNHDEKLSNSSKVVGLNKYKELSHSNEEHTSLSNEENVYLQVSSEDPKMGSLTKPGEYIKDSQYPADRREQGLSKQEGNEAYSGTRKELTSESTNGEENYLSRTEKKPSSSMEDNNMQSESVEDEKINSTSNEKSNFIQPRLPDQTNSHSSNTDSTVYILDSRLTKEPSETAIRKFSYATKENDEPCIDLTKANGEIHSDEESKEDQTLLEPHLNSKQQEVIDHDYLIHPETSDVIDPADSNAIICTRVKPVDEGKESETEAPHTSFRTFSLVLPQIKGNRPTTETSNELKVYPTFEHTFRISNNFIPRKGCGNTNSCVQVENIEYMSHHNDYNIRRDKRNSKEIENSEKTSNRGKYLLSLLEDEAWQKKIKALEKSFDEQLGPPEKSV